MALNFEHTWSWSFLIPVACMSFCWYLISIYWFWWMRDFRSAFSCSVLRYLGVRFQVLQKKAEDCCKALGKINVKYENQEPVVSVTDPDLIKEMLTHSFDTFGDAKIKKRSQISGHCSASNRISNLAKGNWESIRRSISLAFTPGKFRRCSHIMDHCCQELCDELISKAKRKTLIDVKKIFDDFCMNMTFSLMFGINKNGSKDSEEMLITQALELLRNNLRRNASFFRKSTGSNLSSFLGTTFMTAEDLLNFEDIVSHIIKERLENNQIKTDFLQLLMESISLGKHANEFRKREELHNASASSKAMASSYLISHCILFFAEGYRVISSVLSLVLYNLALSPNDQERLRKEVKEVLLLEKRTDFYSVGKMTYLDQVICETLRLHTPVKRLQRFAADNYVLDGADVIIPKGSEINIPFCAIHRNSVHYPNPENFDPRRFAPTEWSKRHPYAFIPFGVGARNCIGMKLALMEIKLCLVHLMKHFRFLKAPKTKIPLEFHDNEILTEPKEVQLHAEKVTI